MAYTFLLPCRRKQLEVQQTLEGLGMEKVEEQLQLATSMPAQPGYRFSAVVQVIPGPQMVLHNASLLVI